MTGFLIFSVSFLISFQLTPLQGTFALPKFSVRGTAAERACPAEAQCNPSYPYRTVDGSCNNQQNADWGNLRQKHIFCKMFVKNVKLACL